MSVASNWNVRRNIYEHTSENVHIADAEDYKITSREVKSSFK